MSRRAAIRWRLVWAVATIDCSARQGGGRSLAGACLIRSLRTPALRCVRWGRSSGQAVRRRGWRGR